MKYLKKNNLQGYFLPILLFSMLTSCVSVKQHNRHLETKIEPKELHEDINFAYQKLIKLHPNLYEFISKEHLKFKFDSIKKNISQPGNSQELYQKLAPVIAEVRQGHLRLIPPVKKLEKKETKRLKKQKGLFSRFNYLIDNKKLYVLDNASSIKNMEVGAEIIAIHNIATDSLLNSYKPYINSDGYNTTYQNYSLARRWPTYFNIENGILDSVKVTTKYKNEERTFFLKREEIKEKEIKEEKKITKEKSNSNKNNDYNPISKTYNRNLNFITKDSAVAMISIKQFSGIRAKRFYKESFKKIKAANSKFLILDVRNNLGGSLDEIQNLYRYLGSNNYPFIKDIGVTTRSSMLQADYFSAIPKLAIPIAVITYPIYASTTLLSTKKSGDSIVLKNNSLASTKPKKNSFTGKIYVLINGSSFSASSILASKLKADNRAILIGEETGGANDGTVAGRYATKKLPHSKLKFPISLMYIAPNINKTHSKKGVTPHFEILPSLEQRFRKQDVILEWLLEEIKKEP